MFYFADLKKATFNPQKYLRADLEEFILKRDFDNIPEPFSSVIWLEFDGQIKTEVQTKNQKENHSKKRNSSKRIYGNIVKGNSDMSTQNPTPRELKKEIHIERTNNPKRSFGPEANLAKRSRKSTHSRTDSSNKRRDYSPIGRRVDRSISERRRAFDLDRESQSHSRSRRRTPANFRMRNYHGSLIEPRKNKTLDLKKNRNRVLGGLSPARNRMKEGNFNRPKPKNGIFTGLYSRSLEQKLKRRVENSTGRVKFKNSNLYISSYSKAKKKKGNFLF